MADDERHEVWRISLVWLIVRTAAGNTVALASHDPGSKTTVNLLRLGALSLNNQEVGCPA